MAKFARTLLAAAACNDEAAVKVIMKAVQSEAQPGLTTRPDDPREAEGSPVLMPAFRLALPESNAIFINVQGMESPDNRPVKG